MLALLVDALAAYRLARLIALDEGPAGLALKLRGRLGAFDYGPNGQPATNLGRGISCPYCVGAYAALLMLVLRYVPGGDYLKAWLAIAGGQSFLQSVGKE